MGCTTSMRIAQDNENNHSKAASGNSDVTAKLLQKGNSVEHGTPTHGGDKRQGDIEADEVLKGEGKARGQTTDILSDGSINDKVVDFEEEIRFGPMRIAQEPMSILLVFPKKSSQCESFVKAAEKSGHECTSVSGTEEAITCHREKSQNLVIVDTRPVGGKNFDHEKLAKAIRDSPGGEYTVLVAIRRLPQGKSETSILPLLKAGYNRQFIENTSVTACANELASLRRSEVLLQTKLKAAQALLVAVEHSNEAVEVTNEKHEIEYANPVLERLSGLTGEELEGKHFCRLSCAENERLSITDAFNSQIKNGKAWDGIYHVKRKDDEKLCPRCRVIPVLGPPGKIRHFVSIRSRQSENCPASEGINGGVIAGTVSPIGIRPRKESVVRLKSMSIETPISKVIFMINALRDSSSTSTAESLDRILEVLRSSELYHPNLSQQFKDDKTTSDLVGGLMNSLDEESLHQRRVSNTKRPSCSSEINVALRHRDSHPAVHPLSLSSEVDKFLDKEVNWDFNVIDLERITNKSPLVHLAMRTLLRFEVCEFLQIDEKLLLSWLQLMETNYHPTNPYHNSTHAADVMHATSYFLNCDRLKILLDPVDEVASLLSAIIHDLDHPGKTNSHLINAGAEVSLLYNDLAVLESHHVSLAYRLTLKDDKVNIFKNLTRDDYKLLRQQIVDMVLATEMTRHFEHLNRFVTMVDQDSLETESLTDDSKMSHLHTSEAKTLIKRMLIKCADVSNPARPLILCKEWAQRIATEYCNQTEVEKSRGLPVVMPVFDRNSCSVPKSQIGFIDLFITDMFTAWNNFCNMPEIMKNVNENYTYWKEQELASSRRSSEPADAKFS